MSAVEVMQQHAARQPWASNRHEFRRQMRAQADEGLRTVRCANCGGSLRDVDGPTGRAWFKSHGCAA